MVDPQQELVDILLCDDHLVSGEHQDTSDWRCFKFMSATSSELKVLVAQSCLFKHRFPGS